MILDCYLFPILLFKLLLTLVKLLAVIAPKKVLAALAAKDALVEKAVGKRKRPMPTAKERDFHHLRRGPSIPKAV